MDKFVISGGNKLKGEIKVSGAKNAAMKVLLAGLLTKEKIILKNVPLISSVEGTVEILSHLGVKVDISKSNILTIDGSQIRQLEVPLEMGGLFRTATMVMGPLLSRFKEAKVPNPGGCRLGKRPIDWHIEGLKRMGAQIRYDQGYFYAKTKGLRGVKYTFSKNTHTGTENLILAGVLAKGETVLSNASEEPEVDDLISLLNLMGAKIKRTKKRTIVIWGVKNLHGAEFTIMPDRNEVVTWGIGAIASRGDIVVDGAQEIYLQSFLNKLTKAGAGWKIVGKDRIRFYGTKTLNPTNVTTQIHPGFMTDWQAPWAVLMTQADGTSTIHETIFEDRFGYVSELRKLGAQIEFYNPKAQKPEMFYNFNWSDRKENNLQAVKIKGKTKFHNAVLEVTDLRAGATLVLGALIAGGESIIHGIEHIDRGYENIEMRLSSLGAKIKRIKE